MRFVIDNNQLSHIRKTTVLKQADKRRMTLVLPPLIWAEAVSYRRDNLRSLLDYSVRFGKDVSEVLTDAAEATDAQLMEVDPLVRGGSDVHRRCRSDLRECPSWRKQRADEIKEGNRDDMKRTRDALSAYEKPPLSKNLTSLDEAIAEFGPKLAEMSFWHNADHPPARARTFADLLSSGDAGLTNFVRYHLCLNVGYLRVWENETLNIAPPTKHDHVPDMSLPLYAREGDIIVTEDKLFRRFFAMAEPTGRVRVMAWKDCLKHVL